MIYYISLHSILHGFTCNYMEFVLVRTRPAAWASGTGRRGEEDARPGTGSHHPVRVAPRPAPQAGAITAGRLGPPHDG
jgi:hypothetical protein